MSSAHAHRMLGWFALVLFLVLVFASLYLRGPQVEADEGSYLLGAAVIAGKLGKAVAHGYYSGYSLLLTPALLIGQEPARSYHIALVLNALMTASIPFALFKLTSLLRPDLDPRWPLIASVAATCYAPTLTLSQYTMSDNALVPMYAWFLASVATALYRTGILPAIAAGALAGMLMLVHPRGGIIALPALAILSLAAFRRRLLRRPVVFMWLAVLLISALHAPLEHLAGKSGGFASSYGPGTIFERFAEPSNWLWVGANLAGATTTAVVTSLGVAVLAALKIFDVARHQRVKDILDMSPEYASLLATALGLITALVTTALFFAPPTRADQIAYGRYALPTLVPLIAIGLLRFREVPEQRARDGIFAVATGLFGVVLMALVFTRVPAEIAGTWVFINAVALDLAKHALPTAPPWVAIGVFFVGGSLLLYAIRRRSALAAFAVFICFNLGAAASGWLFVTRPLSVYYSGGGPVVEAALEFKDMTGSPLCLRVEGLDAWYAVDVTWRLFPQISESSLLDRNKCTRAVIHPLAGGNTDPSWRLVAVQRPSPINEGPIGIFVEPGPSLDLYARAHALPPGDALSPLPAQDRKATIAIINSGIPTHVFAGDTLAVTVRITNVSQVTWTPTDNSYLPYPIRPAAQAARKANPAVDLEYRTEFDKPLKPGESEVNQLRIGPFKQPGRYRLRIGVVQEHVAWFKGAIDTEMDVVEK